MSNETYLGNGVHVCHEDDAILLTTKDDVKVINEVFLDRQTLAAFLNFVLDEKPATWSKDAPSEPGFYWFRPSDLTQFRQVVQVSRNSIGNLRASVGGGAFYPVEELRGLWYSETIREPGGER